MTSHQKKSMAFGSPRVASVSGSVEFGSLGGLSKTKAKQL